LLDTCDNVQKRVPAGITIAPNDLARSSEMTLGTVILIVLVLALLGVIPAWPHSRGWGYGPSGVMGLVVVVLLVLLLTGRL
jgi:hypothetical protein